MMIVNGKYEAAVTHKGGVGWRNRWTGWRSFFFFLWKKKEKNYCVKSHRGDSNEARKENKFSAFHHRKMKLIPKNKNRRWYCRLREPSTPFRRLLGRVRENLIAAPPPLFSLNVAGFSFSDVLFFKFYFKVGCRFGRSILRKLQVESGESGQTKIRY